MESITAFLMQRLKLTVNQAKSAVDRPWQRKFLGYSGVFQGSCRFFVFSMRPVERLYPLFPDSA